MFIENLKAELNNEKQLTENGAVGYVTSGQKLLDLNFMVSSLRNAPEETIEKYFADAFYEDPLLAIKWLFYGRDVRGGLGERRLFRVCLRWLAVSRGDLVKALIPLIQEYGRFDDLFSLFDDVKIGKYVMRCFGVILEKDYIKMRNGEPISLAAKWAPRVNTSSKETKRLAKKLRNAMGYSERAYRKLVSEMNRYIDTVEVKMSANEWSVIDYNNVPSRANLIYKDAFMRHDESRRQDYLDSLSRGEAKINAGALFPNDIVHKYTNGGWTLIKERIDTTIEELWKNLPDYVNGANNVICVADGSGSMCVNVGNTRVTALEVANSLAIYFAERSSGEFKDKYITFSEKPRLVDFSRATSLNEKINIALAHNEIANTNIEAVFNLILNTAVKNKMKQKDLPKTILILSDCEFDAMTDGDTSKAMFERFADKYREHEYELPRLVFWNIDSRTKTVPIQQNKNGVALVSGFSPAIVNMVLSNELDPYKCLLQEINNDRYNPVEEAIQKYVEENGEKLRNL